MADSHTSDFECAETYFGASPFSEPEETAVAKLIAELGRVEWYIGAYPLFTCSSEELTCLRLPHVWRTVYVSLELHMRLCVTSPSFASPHFVTNSVKLTQKMFLLNRAWETHILAH